MKQTEFSRFVEKFVGQSYVTTASSALIISYSKKSLVTEAYIIITWYTHWNNNISPWLAIRTLCQVYKPSSSPYSLVYHNIIYMLHNRSSEENRVIYSESDINIRTINLTNNIRPVRSLFLLNVIAGLEMSC